MKPVLIFAKVIDYGYEGPAWSQWDLFDLRQNAIWLWATSEQGKLRRSKVRVYSCGTPPLMKVRSLYTLNLWQDPLKARALVYKFAFNITKMRWRALQRNSLFYLASKPPPINTHRTFIFCSFFPLPFQVQSKGLRKYMQSFAPLKRKQVTGFMSVCLILYPVSCLSFPFFWKKHLSRLIYTLNKPVLTKQGGEQRI